MVDVERPPARPRRGRDHGDMHRRMELGAWIEAYGRAWETGDEDLMATLFTDDASRRSSPFREPFRASTRSEPTGVANAGTQRDKRVRWMGRPFVDGEPRRGRVVDDDGR